MNKQQYQANLYPPPTTYNGREVKYFDMNVGNSDIIGSTKQMDNHDFPQIPQGVGQSERVGDAIEAVRLDFNYEVEAIPQNLGIIVVPPAPPTALDSGETAMARIMLVVDKRVRGPSGHIDLTPHDIMQPNGDGNDLNMYSFHNMENSSQYYILHDKIHKLQPQFAPDLVPEGFEVKYTYTTIASTCSFNTIDLRGLQLYYDSVEPWPSLHNIKLLAMSNGDNLIAYRFYMRLYYID